MFLISIFLLTPYPGPDSNKSTVFTKQVEICQYVFQSGLTAYLNVIFGMHFLSLC